MKNLVLALCLSALTGCVGDAKEAPPGTTPLNARDTSEPLNFTGVWSLQGDDEYYLVVRDGHIGEYDYRDDEAGGWENCYDYRGFTYAHIGGDTYELTTSRPANVFRVQVVLLDSALLIASGMADSYSLAGRVESDFSPECR